MSGENRFYNVIIKRVVEQTTEVSVYATSQRKAEKIAFDLANDPAKRAWSNPDLTEYKALDVLFSEDSAARFERREREQQRIYKLKSEAFARRKDAMITRVAKTWNGDLGLKTRQGVEGRIFWAAWYAFAPYMLEEISDDEWLKRIIKTLEHQQAESDRKNHKQTKLAHLSSY